MKGIHRTPCIRHGLLPPMGFVHFWMVGIISLGLGTNQLEAEEIVTAGAQISIEYTLTLKDGRILDTNVDGDPMVYTHGSDKRSPIFAKYLEGLGTNETKQFTMLPEEHYEAHEPEKIIEVPVATIPGNKRFLGATLEGRSEQGHPLYGKVLAVKDNIIVLDTNHPLAGETLFFEVRILAVKQPSTRETD